jgi:serine/threonine protein phosphatase PrpC
VNTPFAYLSSVELTDVGRRRKNNEDSLIRVPEAGLFCVADGMGGVQGGEIASKACVDALQKEFTASPDAAYAVTAEASAKLVERALNSASKWIKDRAESIGVSGTGSTAVALVFDRVTPARGLALHAGDSRAYRLRGDKIMQLTADHSVAAAAGLPDDSSLPPMFRGVITRAVGLDRHVELDATPFDVVPNDVFLLCSDGLSKLVSDRRILKLARKHGNEPLETLARVLVDEALEAGGDDNVTVVLIQVAGDLPKGPTMETPPQTRALEQQASAPAATPGAPHSKEEDHDATGQTADGGGAVTAGTIAEEITTPTSDKENGTTPTTPDSNGKPATPSTPAPLTAAEAEPDKTSSPSRRFTGFLVVLLIAAITGVVLWRVLE